ncbi:hypothetical protein V6N13_127331 [Hibiscus sabdariffa]
MVGPNLMANITRETLGLIRRVKEELKLARMRSAANRQWLRSTQGVDIELTLITMVAEPIAPLTTGIAVEIPDGINWRREEAEGVAGMAGMSDQTRQLTAGSVEVEVAGFAGVHPPRG